ncbi:hypothetical protein AOZ07_01345 [Glutamicibacter halophytocola]|nr:hypothetical protein AOZ07_01345 [Glutamicibacter halophytocola]
MKNYLEKRNADYKIHDVTADPDALQRLKDLGYIQNPVVFDTHTGDHWYGFNPTKIDAAIAAANDLAAADL